MKKQFFEGEFNAFILCCSWALALYPLSFTYIFYVDNNLCAHVFFSIFTALLFVFPIADWMYGFTNDGMRSIKFYQRR